ncbi:ATPase [Paenibacillus sp. FSL H8-0548]|uniref:N-acetylglucosamine kinase n=1 Tax=Paenibacillus sp. FSL H8-0548 TaxID=1920422 RepID=UPI00096EF5B0|nr:BadF/BadG/BcrA/BcrD ATPase family protein [Paenibacillus sp. FSL H8-0548]OMF27600.1 ATPase [Paenibacillus sp. FSL H8-0548]
MAIVMGVDGGGSKTYAVIVNEQGVKLGAAVAGSGNYQRIGIESAITNIRLAIDSALESAMLTREQIDFVQYGLAGADRAKDFSILLPALATIPFSKWDLVCDTMIGLRTGSMKNTGVVLICGSGTNAAGRSRDGQMVQVGGFGELFGDRAGGEYLSAATFKAAVRSIEGRERASRLTDTVAAFFGHDTLDIVIESLLDEDIASVPEELTVVLHETAAEGDELAIQLLREAGQELGLSANSVIRRLGDFGAERIPIVLIGSVIQKGRSPHLLNGLQKTLESENINHVLIIPEMAPVYGAVLLALDHEKVLSTESLESIFVQYGGYQE